MALSVHSEIGKLEMVLVHTPASEVENMTPDSASDVLYDDILNLPLAAKEHAQLTGVLQQVSKTVQLKDLLSDVLQSAEAKNSVVSALTTLYRCPEHADHMLALSAPALAAQLIEGTRKRISSLERFLDKSPYAIPPLPNAFFTRDATMCVSDGVIIGSMAHPARVAESVLLKAIFRHHPKVHTDRFFFDGTVDTPAGITIEGGDLLILRKDLIMIGYSERTSVRAIDLLMKSIAAEGAVQNFIVVEIPQRRASIHLDMLFTMVDVDKCVVYPPMLEGSTATPAYHCVFSDEPEPVMVSVTEHPHVLGALDAVGMPLEPIACGGPDRFHQEREQWASGANFFAFAPGQIMGYAHNVHTIEAMAQAGFNVVHAKNVVDGSRPIAPTEQILVTMDGSELSRGGGGCRCMTLPLSRAAVESRSVV